jgi:hypothetical protein
MPRFQSVQGLKHPASARLVSCNAALRAGDKLGLFSANTILMQWGPPKWGSALARSSLYSGSPNLRRIAFS